jgi:UDP-N-acetylglucosamine--N-acetylmuramyl-(pentapeptide) pyrophosphoryl-undecaprenol N-acetylglucosamine transferase
LDLEQKRVEALAFFNLDSGRQTLLVLGGSLGSRRINQLIESKLKYFNALGIQIVWQCGKLYSDDYIKHNSGDLVQVQAFINRMDLAYACADFVISRAGASSVSELCIVGKPVIFIPSPNVSEDHQTKNALAITKNKAAILISEKDLDLRFESEFSVVLNSKPQQELLSENIKKLALIKATKSIVEEIEKLLVK